MPRTLSSPLTLYVGRTLSRIRIERGLSQEAVGKMLGVTASAICYYESGRNAMKLDSFVALCDALGVEPGDLLTEAVINAPRST